MTSETFRGNSAFTCRVERIDGAVRNSTGTSPMLSRRARARANPSMSGQHDDVGRDRQGGILDGPAGQAVMIAVPSRA